jgi:hypothetical protein
VHPVDVVTVRQRQSEKKGFNGNQEGCYAQTDKGRDQEEAHPDPKGVEQSRGALRGIASWDQSWAEQQATHAGAVRAARRPRSEQRQTLHSERQSRVRRFGQARGEHWRPAQPTDCSRWGFSVPVVVRKQSAVVQVLRDNPFLRAGADIKALHVAFLADLPKAAQIAALDHARSPGDEFAVLGSEIYLLLPNGVARSKLTNAYFDRALATVSTIRNWNTVQILTTL